MYVSMATNSQALLADESLAVYGNINDLQLDMQIDPPNDTGELNMIQPSPFYSIHQMPPHMIQTRGQFHLLSLNAQSLNAKFDDLLLLIEILHHQNIHFHAICLQETWLSDNADLSLLQIDGYKCIARGKRPECSNHGGLMIYVNEEFNICILDIENDSSLWENIFVSVKKPFGKINIVICNIYIYIYI